MTKTKSIRGFTLLEILLVVGIIAILAGIVIIAINPAKQLSDARNAQRRSDVLTILNAIYQYEIDHNGQVTNLNSGHGFAGDTTDNCTDADTEAFSGLNNYLVTASSTYLTAIPVDPTTGVANSSSDYWVHSNTSSGRITVCAPSAENGVVIKVTR